MISSLTLVCLKKGEVVYKPCGFVEFLRLNTGGSVVCFLDAVHFLSLVLDRKFVNCNVYFVENSFVDSVCHLPFSRLCSVTQLCPIISTLNHASHLCM